MSEHFFITTPIYYSNGVPHIGHAYSSFLADTIARYEKLQGREVKFSTGVDENSQKVVESAEALGMETIAYADMMAEKHRAVWDGTGIEYTDFIRTTEPRHIAFVQQVLQKSYDNGDIYEGVYNGMYCVGCEAFKKESDLIEKDGKLICPDHPTKELQHLSEKNYFFRLSKYEGRLLEFYESHPDFIVPRSRFSEVIEFVKSGLEDFSVSRETNKFGIPLPFDREQVTYVWYDALFNYLTVCQGEEKKWWPQKDAQSGGQHSMLHVIGKDIVRFHAIYWPAMLWSAGYEAPEQLLVTGHFTVDGQKMSKSIGNVIDPVEYIAEHGRDALILYLFTAFPIGEDGDFSQEQAVLQFNAKLANNIGNLLNRCLTLSLKLDGKLSIREDRGMTDKRKVFIDAYKTAMEIYNLKDALDLSFAYGTELNQYIDTMKPWKMDVATERDTFEETLSTISCGLYTIGQALLPFFEAKMTEMLARLGTPCTGVQSFDLPSGFTIAEKGEPLYLRVEIVK